MKKMISLFLMISSLSAFAQPFIQRGGVTSGGIPGFQFLQCEGELIVSKTEKVTAALSVHTDPRKGFVIRVTDKKGFRVLEDGAYPENTLMGKIWHGTEVRVTIPKIQNRDLGAGEVRAIVKFAKADMASIVECQKWEMH